MTHARLRDVATKCGVSVSTASRALNNRIDVNPQTRQRVLEAAKALGYVPSSLAKGLWSGETRTVGILVTTILNPFYANVVTGIEEVLKAAGYNIFLNSSHEDPDLELQAIKLLLEQRVDGIILAPVQSNPEAVEYLEKNKVPFVLVGRGADNNQSDFVVCDDREIGQLAAQHLIEMGHRRILFLNSFANQSAKLRAQGFFSASQNHGLGDENILIRAICPKQSLENVLDDVFNEEPRPTAIFCFCDDMTLEVLKELRKRNLKVPKDIALMGVDNLEYTQFLSPALTTIDVQQNQMGTKAAEILLARLAQRDKRPEQVVLRPKLIVRKSS